MLAFMELSEYIHGRGTDECTPLVRYAGFAGFDLRHVFFQ
jgi:hypothetical protein